MDRRPALGRRFDPPHIIVLGATPPGVLIRWRLSRVRGFRFRAGSVPMRGHLSRVLRSLLGRDAAGQLRGQLRGTLLGRDAARLASSALRGREPLHLLGG